MTTFTATPFPSKRQVSDVFMTDRVVLAQTDYFSKTGGIFQALVAKGASDRNPAGLYLKRLERILGWIEGAKQRVLVLGGT